MQVHHAPAADPPLPHPPRGASHRGRDPWCKEGAARAPSRGVLAVLQARTQIRTWEVSLRLVVTRRASCGGKWHSMANNLWVHLGRQELGHGAAFSDRHGGRLSMLESTAAGTPAPLSTSVSHCENPERQALVAWQTVQLEGHDGVSCNGLGCCGGRWWVRGLP